MPESIKDKVLILGVGCSEHWSAGSERRIGSVDDIEDAVRLGLGYPYGPLSSDDRIGGDKVLLILKTLRSLTSDPRYRPSPSLARRVNLGVSLLTAEAEGV
jgi:3-hydroxybutyryl-CoA dehydrogenase